MEIFIQTVNYITNANFFYHTMGITAASSIFIGAAIYNGEIRDAWKGIITIGAYAGLLIIMTVSRVVEAIQNQAAPHSPNYMAYAGIVTALFLALYYIMGIIIGVYTIKRIHGRDSSHIS